MQKQEINVVYLNKLDGDGRFSNTSPAHNDDFVRLCYTTTITRLRHDDRRPAGCTSCWESKLTLVLSQC